MRRARRGHRRRREGRHVCAKRFHELGIRLPATGRGALFVELARGAVDELGQRQVHVALGAGHQAEHVLERRVQAEW